MALTPISQEQVQKAVQVVLDYLSNPANSTPNDILEGIVSGKSLLRGIAAGSLVVCQNQDVSPVIPPLADSPEKPVRKKVAKKRASKKKQT